MYHYHHYDDNYHDHHHPHDHQPQPWLTRTDWCEHKSDWPSRRSVCSTGILHPASQAWTEQQFSTGSDFSRGSWLLPIQAKTFQEIQKNCREIQKTFPGQWLLNRWELERERIEFGIEVKWEESKHWKWEGREHWETPSWEGSVLFCLILFLLVLVTRFLVTFLIS